MDFVIRKATFDDQQEIARLVEKSVRGLGRTEYSDRQIELSIKSVFGVDVELIRDQTYFVAEASGTIVGCGGWSRRRTLYGASVYSESRNSAELDPKTDAAKIRAFFVHPGWARKGIGRTILAACENEAKEAGFRSAEMMSTLPGVPLYSACGYKGDERVGIPVGEGVEVECVHMRKSLE